MGELAELLLQPHPHHGVDGPERLVHQQQRWVRGQRPGHADPLPLPPGELVGVARPVHVGLEPDQVEQLLGPRAGL